MKLKTYQKRGILVLIGILMFKLLYTLIQKTVSTGVALNTTLDFAIPFIPLFVIFYLLLYPSVLIPFMLSLKRPAFFKRVSFSFIAIVSVSFAVYLLFQTQISRAAIESVDIFSSLVMFIYQNDMPLNCFPSLHVSGSMMANYCTFQLKKKWGYFMVPLTILIVLSTLFIKQHFILDVIFGAFLATLVYVCVFKINWNKLKEYIVSYKA